MRTNREPDFMPAYGADNLSLQGYFLFPVFMLMIVVMKPGQTKQRETVKGASMVRFNGIHHMAMVTGDMDSTTRFWRDLLGMRLVAGLGKPGYRHYFFEISTDYHIAFFEWTGAEPVPEKDHGQPVKGRIIFDHVSFGIESAEGLWDLKDRIAAAGFWVSDVIDHGIIHSIYTFDPNGIPIEFSYVVPGVDIGKNPHMVDSAPSFVTLEGPEPSPGVWPAVKEATPAAERHVFPGEGRELLQAGRRNHYARGRD